MLWTMNGMYMPNNITEIHSSYYLSDIAFKIPNVECNITLDFAHNSERNNYLKGLATLDNNWHYRHKKVIYKFIFYTIYLMYHNLINFYILHRYCQIEHIELLQVIQKIKKYICICDNIISLSI